MSAIIGRKATKQSAFPSALGLLLLFGSPRGQGVIKAERITIKRTMDGECHFPHLWCSTGHSEGVNYTLT